MCLTVLNSSKIFFDVSTKNNVSDFFQMLEQNNHWKICVCVCMYVCMYVCKYVCMCVYVRMYVCMYPCINVSMFVSMYVWMYACVYRCMYVSLYISMNVRMYICMYEYMYVCIYVCIFVCMYVCMYVWSNAATYGNCQIDAAKWLQIPQSCSYQGKVRIFRLHFKVYGAAFPLKIGDFSKKGQFLSSRERIPIWACLHHLKQDFSGLSGFYGRLRSKSCFKLSGWAVFERFIRFERFERFERFF